MKNLFIISFLLLTGSFNLFSQCDITATGSPLEICVGDCIDLNSTGGCPNYLMYNDFNTQTVGTGWSSNASPMFNNPCGSFGADGTPYAWIGPASTFPRNLTTVAYAVTAQCQICFDFMMSTQGNSSPCEGPDEMDEGVSLQYSTNGGATWIDITYFCPNGNQYPTNSWVGTSSIGGGSGTPFNSWANYCFNVPAGGAGPNTMFQWHQEQVTDYTYDHWGVDNVYIFCPPPSQTVTWSESVGGTIIFNNFDPPQQCPTQTTTYTVTITDGSSSATDQITVVVHGPPTLTFALPASFCSNSPAYNLVGNPSGGTFSGTGVTGSSFNPSSVPVGTNISITYTYNTWNAGGTVILCTHTVTNTTIVNPAPTSTFTANDVCVTSNSTVSYTGSAGAGATYSWNFGGGTIVSGTGPGPYQISWPNDGTFNITLTVTENGCTSTLSTETVTVWAAGSPNCCNMPTPNAGPDDNLCGLTYTLQGIASIGVGTWTYTGPGTATFTNANSATSSVTVSTYGTYIFTWTEDNGTSCVIGDGVQIIFYNTTPANAGADQTICSGTSATLTATGGGTYIWSTTETTASITVSPMVTTTYTVTVDDGSGCPASDDVTVTVNTSPVANAGTGGTFCSDTYTFNAVASSGTGTWSYSGPGTASFTNVNSANSNVTVNTWGTYTFTWTENNNGCIDSDDVTVTFNYTPTSAFSVAPASLCIGDTATVTYTGTGSAGATYNWNWNGGTANPGSGQGPNTVSWSNSGSYSITLSVSESGCTSTITNVPVTVNPNPTSTFTVTQPDCYGDDAILTYTGNATGAANYIWNFGGGNASPGNGIGPQYVNWLVAGTYSVSLSVSENGCTSAITTQSATNPTQLTSLIVGTNIICHGQLDGAADLTATGGTPPLTYLWSNSYTGEDLTDVPADDYSVIVTDASGCTSESFVSINEPSSILVTASPDKFICNGQTVNISASASGGTGTYTYWWNGIPGGASINVGPSMQTTYAVYVIDANGCQSNTDLVIVFVSPAVTLDLYTNTDHICPGDEVVMVAGINNGVPPYYLYDQFDMIVMPPFIVHPMDTTEYIIYVEDQCGSIASDNLMIYTYPLPPVAISSDTTSGCQPLTVNFLSQYQAQTYTWNFGDSDFDNLSFQKDPSHIYDNPGVYTVSLSVTSTEGCLNSITEVNMISVYPKPIAKFINDPEAASIIKPMIFFYNLSSGHSESYWNFGDGAESNLENPVHVYPIYPTGTYNVMLVVETNFGCLDTAYKDVTIQNEYTFYAPTAFSPDYDGINDYFLVYGNGIDKRNFKMIVFDRWGEPVYENEDINEGWDGRIKGGEIGKNGTYTWLVIYKDLKGIEHEETGAVSIIR
ncbi:MAG: PKD domain-containing protein [Bacteroidota bacterium]